MGDICTVLFVVPSYNLSLILKICEQWMKSCALSSWPSIRRYHREFGFASCWKNMNSSNLGSWSSCCSALVWSLAMATSLQLSQAENLTWWPIFLEPWASLCSSKIKKSWMYLWVKLMTGLCVQETKLQWTHGLCFTISHCEEKCYMCPRKKARMDPYHVKLMNLTLLWVMCGMHAVLSVISGIGVAASHQYRGEYHESLHE